MKPDNALSHSIEKLIEDLKNLPPDTTFEYVDNELHGGQSTVNGKKLGTGHSFKVNIVDGWQDIL
jgi:hypothetical protein